MKKIVARIDFLANGIEYIKGDEISNLTYNQIAKLNEEGFIEPLEYRDLVIIKRELDNLNEKKEEL